MKKFKARLRAWLIDLVREAIRIERNSVQPVRSTAPRPPLSVRAVETVALKTIEGVDFQVDFQVFSDQSFEQLQEEALKAQEKYYEPERA